MVTVISDCESDIYEIFAAPRSAHVHLLVRAEHNRRLSDGGKLFAAMAALPHVDGQEIVVSAKDGRPTRKARTRVNWQEIERGARAWASRSNAFPAGAIPIVVLSDFKGLRRLYHRAPNFGLADTPVRPSLGKEGCVMSGLVPTIHAVRRAENSKMSA